MQSGKGIGRKAGRAVGLAMFGFAAAVIPVLLFLQREFHDAPEPLRAQGWPLRLLHVIFARYISRWIEKEGLENLPKGSYLVAANHGYRSGVDGFVLGHLLAMYAGRVPRIVMTAEHRNWMVRMERWVLHYYGIALLVRDESKGREASRKGLSDIMADYLKASSRHIVIIFPAGRAETDPALQLTDWSTGAVVAARKSGCPVVPVAFSGLPFDWTPETVIAAALKADGAKPPFRIHVRIGEPVVTSGDPRLDLEQVRSAIANLMMNDRPLAPVITGPVPAGTL